MLSFYVCMRDNLCMRACTHACSMCCSMLQYVAVCCYFIPHLYSTRRLPAQHCNTLQTLQHTTTYCNTDRVEPKHVVLQAPHRASQKTALLHLTQHLLRTCVDVVLSPHPHPWFHPPPPPPPPQCRHPVLLPMACLEGSRKQYQHQALLQCVAVCCSVLQCVAVYALCSPCCTVCVAVCTGDGINVKHSCSVSQCVAVCSSV